MKSLKLYFVLFLVCFKAISLKAGEISDSVHISHTTIVLDSVNNAASRIAGHAELIVHFKLNGIAGFSLMLQGPMVDSAHVNGAQVPFVHSGNMLHIDLPGPVLMGDSALVSIFYRGTPAADPSGWGGFYFTGGYSFNLGVGFESFPHGFGRAWFPCLDDFREKGTYEFFITTLGSEKAFCNGILISENMNGDGTKTWHWKIYQPISSYLVSVAVAPFYTMHRTYSGIPCEFAIMPGDSLQTISSFANFGTAVSAFSNAYGLYPFDKIGFVMTPVVYGGMEHAASIHLSKSFVTGNLDYETLYAHEIAHMWWGDKVTCKTSSDMWLNEGMATFNEHLYLQALYGDAAYKESFLTPHREVLQRAHIEDSTYWAHNNLSENYTYANLSVYTKGALTAHTLRYYMGDTLFFNGCKDYMQNLAYSSASSADFRDQLSASSGLNLNDFFDDWVFTPGFPQFSVDSFSVLPLGSNFIVSVFTKQKRKGASHISKMKVEINFSNDVQDSNAVFLLDAATNAMNIQLPFNPEMVTIDRHEKMMEAVTDFEHRFSVPGSKLMTETRVTLNCLSPGSSPSLVRLEHHFVPPDPFKGNPGIKISDYHFWRVDGFFYSGFHAKATFPYDGSTGANGYMDNALITGTEDSVVLLHRSGPGEDWTVVTSLTKSAGSLTDKRGSFIVDTLKKGEYCFGFYDISYLNIEGPLFQTNLGKLDIFPNPSSHGFTVEIPVGFQNGFLLEVFGPTGKLIFKKEETGKKVDFIPLPGSESGHYLIQISSPDGKLNAHGLLLK